MVVQGDDDIAQLDAARLVVVTGRQQAGFFRGAAGQHFQDQDALDAALAGSLSDASTAQLEFESPEEPADRSGARHGSILVIDDEESNRDLLTRRLTHQGHLVMTADSGEAGLAVAARGSVDLILLDVLMAGLSGYDVLSKLKADATLREIPVLMISALDQTASVTRGVLRIRLTSVAPFT